MVSMGLWGRSGASMCGQPGRTHRNWQQGLPTKWTAGTRGGPRGGAQASEHPNQETRITWFSMKAAPQGRRAGMQ